MLHTHELKLHTILMDGQLPSYISDDKPKAGKLKEFYPNNDSSECNNIAEL